MSQLRSIRVARSSGLLPRLTAVYRTPSPRHYSALGAKVYNVLKLRQPQAIASRSFQTSSLWQKKNDDSDDSDSKKKNKSVEEEQDDDKGRRRRSARRTEGVPATEGEPARPDPLTQLKRAGQQSFIPDDYPKVMMLPITRRPLFPSLYKSIQVQDPQVIGALKELVERGEPYVATFMLKDDEKDVDKITSMDEVHEIGVFSRIMSIYVSPNPEDKHLTVALYPWRRVRMKKIIKAVRVRWPSRQVRRRVSHRRLLPQAAERPQMQGMRARCYSRIQDDYDFTALEVENVADEPYDAKDATVSATMSEIVSVLREITTMNPMFREQIHHFASAQVSKAVFENPSKLADFAAALSSGSSSELQDILSDLNVTTRLEKALVVLKKELMNAQLQNKISKDVEAKISKRQRDFYLMEQLKGIKRELGLESDGKDKLIEQFKAKAEGLQMPEEVKKVFDEEEPAASEFNVTRNYLDWLTQIPWGKQSIEDYDLQRAKVVLDEDHYGLEDVKQRILEFVAVGKLRGAVQGKILCFVGPPGVGKTSIGKSIARALGREFFRFSVGGLTDVAEIKGHRRTYVGAMPGKVVQALKRVQTENPLVLIDEIDKLGRGHQGDPASALLELLDPEQNTAFLDHYMDVPDTIPGPLLDRMEVIRLSGYLADEKRAIAQKYLAPQAKEAAGLEGANVQITDEAVDALIRAYCRESGVRNLKKHIEKIYRKAALKVVESGVAEPAPVEAASVAPAEEKPEAADAEAAKAAPAEEKPQRMVVPEAYKLDISADKLKDYVGPPIFEADRLYPTTPPACTESGESGPRGRLHTTGQLGDVMKESATLAYTYVRALLNRKQPENRFFDNNIIHLHVPEGATPKDGPSAGVTMTTALLSLAQGKQVRDDVAMTGELTLTGRVLKIGGLKEKTIAARRAGVKRILFPKANLADWEELPEHVKVGIEGCPIEWYEEIPPLVGLTV
ncbi:ATP-dependent protease La [Linderina pennispora]|uniref:Lon protease homolog, mitochondrial n=1 Tax=Linderina pennispora TaxID=61395 RepID=A0A1Y1W092_9FUNG|nr:ATP-dependent protease La [Linderina pennispora]ORX66931.1 ATP-dependent protease La [Linderina pennispora]